MNSYDPLSYMKELVSFSKTRGFIYPGSDIYGGLANTWDYGPLGVEIKRKIKDLWWNFFITQRFDMVGLDSGILMNPKVWEASGHTKHFSDPMIDCKECHNRFRADDFIKKYLNIEADGLSVEELNQILLDNKAKLACPECGKNNFTPIRQFQLMFETHQGVTKDSSSSLFLRPETAQGIFTQFKNILQSTRKKLPFGVGQIGKSFRNEITPGNFIFRTREFEQMEIEYFIDPKENDQYYKIWQELTMRFYTDILGIPQELLRVREHSSKELAHYSKATCDVEFLFPFGWGEISGVCARTNFDLTLHQKASGEDLSYTHPQTGENYIPYVIEPSFGVERIFFALLCASYKEEVLQDDKTRVVFAIKKSLAPINIAILPLKKNEPRIVDLAYRLMEELSLFYKVSYDDTGSIGKLYRRQDEIGTPYCITVDFDSLEDQTVTVRDRDTMTQQRIAITQLKEFFNHAYGTTI
jgi:glycyl-tRNA synthetase